MAALAGSYLTTRCVASKSGHTTNAHAKELGSHTTTRAKELSSPTFHVEAMWIRMRRNADKIHPEDHIKFCAIAGNGA